jgi:hypothetical protein
VWVNTCQTLLFAASSQRQTDTFTSRDLLSMGGRSAYNTNYALFSMDANFKFRFAVRATGTPPTPSRAAHPAATAVE